MLSVTQELNFINLTLVNLNLNSPMWLMAIILDNAALEVKLNSLTA